MAGQKVTPWYESLQALWPVVVFVILVITLLVKSQTVSQSSFNELDKRVVKVEQAVPSKESMQLVLSNQAVMQSDLTRLTTDSQDIMRRLVEVSDTVRKRK